MESNNVFSEGMNSDISKIYQGNKQYVKALNYRPITTVGGSNGSLVNIKGNNCENSFPALRGVYKLIVNRTLSNDGVVTLTINGSTTSNITINSSTTTSDIVNYIKALPNCYLGTYSNSLTFTVSYNETSIYIYQQPKYSGCDVNDSTEPTISINSISGYASLSFVDVNGDTWGTQEAFIPQVSGDPLVIIGSTYIGEVNYLFTCPSTNVTKLGQIWESTYNELTKVNTLKLIYNNYLNFSINYPIAPSATLGRYEIPTIQRIYWTDGNNPVRSINIKDSNTMAIDTDLLDLTPSVKLSIATLKQIKDSGAVHNLNAETTYQCAYRLVKNNGAITNYSIASNIVNPVIQPTSRFLNTSPAYASLNGDTGTVNKTITWEVNNIDNTYDTVEFVIITRNVPLPDGYTINKYETQLIKGRTSITTTFVNDTDNFEEISLDEFLIENTAFTHCKTIDQKDNRLFFANVKNGLSDYLESFDTRAFRFTPSTDDIIVKNLDIDLTSITYSISGNDYSVLSETADLIPVYNLGMETSDDPLYDNTCKYQRNSTIIGGEGVNIKYSFGSFLLASDEVPTAPGQSVMGSFLEGSTRDDSGSSQYYLNGYRKAGTISNITSPLIPYYSNLAPQQNYYTQLAKSSMGIEYFGSNFRSYELNEIYRFGIRFYSKNGNAYFVKWIGDVKFPNYNDSVAPGLEGVADDGTLCSDFRSMYISGGKAYSSTPYIQFEVNIPEALSKLISHYEIVRVERKDTDMTITGHGVISQIDRTGFIPNSQYNSSDEKIGFINPDSGTNGSNANSKGFTFHPFKHIVDQSSSLISANDKIIVTEKYGNTVDTALWPLNSVPSGDFKKHWYIRKFYNLIDFIYNNSFNSSFLVENSVFAFPTEITDGPYTLTGLAADAQLSAGNDFYNRTSFSKCSSCVGISTTGSMQWSYFGSDVVWDSSGATVGGKSKLIAIHFKPSVLSSQYKGRTFISRSQNDYISCGALYEVSEAGSTKINVFGGDIFYGVLDIQREIKEYDPSSSVEAHSQTWYFPTHSRYNLDLRSGAHVNCDLNDDGGANVALYNEEYVYNKASCYENTLYKFVPKPFAFNSTSEFSNRIYWSEVKFNGETSDSWTNIPILNYHDVDGNYGGITSLITLRNNMYFLQESSLGILLINQQSLMTDQNDVTLTTGIGTTLDKHLYNSVDIGTKHQWSVYKSNDAITFCDIRHKKLYLFDGQSLNPITDIKGNRGFLNKMLHEDILVTDNPIIGKGIVTTYDFANNEFLYTFLNNYIQTTNESTTLVDEKYTLVYSDLVGAFSSFYSATPYIYINNHNKLYSTNSYNSLEASKLYLHNIGEYGNFYGTIYPSTLKVNINAGGITTKVFDNLSWISESVKDELTNIDDVNNVLQDSDNINQLNDTFSRIRCYNEYQNTDWNSLTNIPITGNLRKTEQGWNIQIPRSKVNYDTYPINTYSIFDPAVLTKTSFGERIRDKYMMVDLEYDNSLNNRFVIHNLKTTFRTSDR